jgi:hypothetical protein
MKIIPTCGGGGELASRRGVPWRAIAHSGRTGIRSELPSLTLRARQEESLAHRTEEDGRFDETAGVGVEHDGAFAEARLVGGDFYLKFDRATFGDRLQDVSHGDAKGASPEVPADATEEAAYGYREGDSSIHDIFDHRAASIASATNST